MSPSRCLALIAATAVAAFASLSAQQPNTEFKISSVDTDFVDTPSLGGAYEGKKRTRGTSKWLEVEVTFDWQPGRATEEKYLDDVTVNYYILLNNKTRENPQGTLLTGSVNHIHLAQGRGLKSVAFVAPRALERLFDGKLPVNARSAISGVGITISKGGTVVAEESTSGRGQWWTEMEATAGMVLNKLETPFAHMAWDYHEPVKPGAQAK